MGSQEQLRYGNLRKGTSDGTYWELRMNVRNECDISSPVYQVTKRVNDNITIVIYKSKIHLPSSISKLVFLKKKKKKNCMHGV